jgi:hypothetical protein
MKYKNKELVVTTVTRSVIKAAGEILNRMNAHQQRLQNLIMDKVESLGFEEVGSIDWDNPMKLIGKYPDLAKDLIGIAREAQGNTMANADFTYELFELAVDKKGWSEEQVQAFRDEYTELYDYEEVAAFVNSFRRKLPQ